jgi:hypothetical protein
MGLPYQDYLNGRRITKAENLLRTNTRSMTEIAVFLFLPTRQALVEFS